MMLHITLLFVSLSLYAKAAHAEANSPDEISWLPGVRFNITFKQYSGFLKVSPKHSLHYW